MIPFTAGFSSDNLKASTSWSSVSEWQRSNTTCANRHLMCCHSALQTLRDKVDPLQFQIIFKLQGGCVTSLTLISARCSGSVNISHTDRQTDRQIGDAPLTISTLCSRCRWQEYPAVCTGWTSWLRTWKWDVAAGLIQRENGGLSRLILPLATSSNGTHGRAAGATELWVSCRASEGLRDTP